MKNLIVFILFLITTIGTNAQTPCENYYPIGEGEEIVMIAYSKKDKIEGYSVMQIKEKSGSSILFNLEYYDEKGEEVLNSEYEIICDDDKMLIDMSNMIPAGTIEGMQEMEVQMTGDALEFPSSLSVGQTLPDGEIVVTAAMNGMQVMNMTMNIFDRKVEDKVSVSTTVGTYECYKLVQSSKTKVSFMTIETSTEDYWSENDGLIKTISYDKKGKLESYSVRGSRSDIK